MPPVYLPFLQPAYLANEDCNAAWEVKSKIKLYITSLNCTIAT